MPPIELNIEMALAERALGGLAHGGEGRHQQVVEVGAVGDLLLEVVGAGPQRLVGERRDLLFQGVDVFDPRLIAANPPFVGGAEQLAGNGADHTGAPNFGLAALYHAAAAGFKLPALRNAALFGQNRRETRGQSATSRG